MTRTKRRVVACLGSSSTAGRGQAFDWIGELRDRPGNAGLEFRNFGIGGDLAWNALQRTPKVIASHPHWVVVWIGGNDVLAQASPSLRRFISVTKRLPCPPSAEGFAEALAQIAQRLRRETGARVGLCSLPPIGEDPRSADPFQARLNQLVLAHSAIVRRVAEAEGCAYIPLGEAIAAAIGSGPVHAFTAFRFWPFYRDAWRVLVLRQTPDEVAARNGWRLHSDGVHLNGHGGRIAAELIQAFIDG